MQGNPAEMSGPQGSCTGVAWPSSARAVRCWVKSRNERNPRPMLPPGNAEHSWETAGETPEEGEDDVRSAWPLSLGLQTRYNARHSGLRYRKVEPIPKSRAQFGSGSATRPREVGVASNGRSACCRECVLGPCTHRPSHPESGQQMKPVAQP